MARWGGGFFVNFKNLFADRRRARPPTPPLPSMIGDPGPGPGHNPPPGHGPPPGQRPVPARVQRRQVQLTNAPPTRAQLRELAQVEARKIELYFNRHRNQFEYVRYLSNGLTGVSCKIRLKSSEGRNTSQFFVVKRTYREDRRQYLRDELRMLELFRGAQHILQLFYIPSSLNNPLIGAPGLTIFTEWIESGTLRNFIDRSMSRPLPLPNRVLLEFFKCLVHFCIAMAWPPNGDMRAPQQEEKIPTDFQKRLRKEQITHNDMHVANVMIGSLDPEGGGHGLVPILKLIDFDRASGVARPSGVNTGVATNIRDIGQVMRTIITGDFVMSPRPGDVTVTVGGSRQTFFTQGADLTATQYKNLDPEIAALVQWCLASPTARPSLELLDNSLTDLMGRATPDRYAGYPQGRYESDDEIRRIVQRYMLDADS